ncbi:MAG: T9SS type A sorting domain-containing protein [Adhaeribacter sp.]
MKYLYKRARQANAASALLFVFAFLLMAPAVLAQVPYPLASGTYTESFDDLANWTADFGAGAGADRFGKATPQPTLPNTNTVFSTNASGGVQKGTGEHLQKIVLLATGTTDGANAAAFDLYLDFSGTAAGALSLDWATVFNATGNRQATFKLQTNTGPNGSFTDLDHPAVVLTNNVAASGALREVALPAAFHQKADARIRFFLITSAGGSTGSRPKVSLDNIRITATAASEPPTPPAAAVTLSAASLADFGPVAAGAASAARSFAVGGPNLSGPVTITPPAGFEVRTGTGAFACCPLVLSPQNGRLAATTVDVRFAPAAPGPQAGSLAVSSPGAADQVLPLSGTGQVPVYPPTLSTTVLSNTGTTGVRTGGSIEADGGSAITERGVVWATTASPDLGAGRLPDGTAATGDFSTQLGGLLPNTTYFLRAYATNAAGTAYGEEFSFTTQSVALAAEPTVAATLRASQVGPASLQLHFAGGNGARRLVLARKGAAVDALPADAVTYAAGAAFGAGAELGTGNFVLYAGTGTSLAVTGLQPNTTYHFAVVEYNDNDTRYAENYLTTRPAVLSQATTAAAGQLLLEEPFDYPAGALLTDHHWSAHSGAGTRPLAVTGSGLSYPGYAASGLAAALVASGEDVHRSFAPVYPRSPVYVSFLVKAANAPVAGDYFLHLGPDPLGTSFRCRVYVRKTASNKVQFGISGSGSSPEYSSQEYDLDAPHLLVLQYSFDETGNLSQLFVNPSSDSEPATATVSAAEAGTTSPASLGSLALRQGSSSPELLVDEIRVATTYRLAKTGLDSREPSLVGAYPNPFADKATIQFSLTREETYTVEVFDPLGHLVEHLTSGTAAAGELVQVAWQPDSLARGVYVVRITSGKNTFRYLRLVWIGER